MCTHEHGMKPITNHTSMFKRRPLGFLPSLDPHTLHLPSGPLFELWSFIISFTSHSSDYWPNTGLQVLPASL